MKPKQSIRGAVDMNLFCALHDLMTAVYDLPYEASPRLHEALWEAHQAISHAEEVSPVDSESRMSPMPDIQVKWEAQGAAPACKLATSK